MPWSTDPAKRQRDRETYEDPEWRKTRAAALRRAGRRCEKCGATGRVEVDHIVPRSQGGSHGPDNAQVLCLPCHRVKSAAEGQDGRRRRAPRPAPRPRTQW